MVFHGAIVLFLGMLWGIPYGLAIVHHWGPEAIHAWSLAHNAGSAGGIAVIVIGGILHLLTLKKKSFNLLFGAILISAYGFVLGMPISALTGEKGMEFTGSLVNHLLYVLNMMSVSGSLVAILLVIIGAYKAQCEKIAD